MDKYKGRIKRIMKRTLGILLSVELAFGMLPAGGFTYPTVALAALDEEMTETVSADYQERSWNDSKVVCTDKKAENCTPVAESKEAVTWNNGWYVVNSNVTISEPITVMGAVNLILADDSILNAEKGIVVTEGNSLTIYAQSGGTGALNTTGTFEGDNTSAGIGGSAMSWDSGAITIHGGIINATGGSKTGRCGGAGIGGGSNYDNYGCGGNSGTITIYGGSITANSGDGDLTGAGIGGGSGGKGGSGKNIFIYGGSVTAISISTSNSGAEGAGIGGGFGIMSGGSGSNIQIYGGTVNATGSGRSAGIGGGAAGLGYASGDGTNIKISGGKVTAVGGNYAAGIGGGGGYKYTTQYVSGSTPGGTGSVTITGGIVDAGSPADVPWKGYNGNPIGNGGNAGNEAVVSKDECIVFENGMGTVCGNVTLDKDYTVPDGYTLNIPFGSRLSGEGTLSGGSTFTIENLTEDMLSVPDNLYYNGKDRTGELTTLLSDALKSGIMICGKAFTATGWKVEIEKTSDLCYTATYINDSDNTDEIMKTITLLKSGATLEGFVKTYNGETETDAFTTDDNITVKATPTATELAPQKASSRLRGGEYTTPASGQMALFVDNVQVSEAVNDEDGDGTYIMTVRASDVLILGGKEPNSGEITLTSKFVGTDNMAGTEGTININISAAAKIEENGTITDYVSDSNFVSKIAVTDSGNNATFTMLKNVTLTDAAVVNGNELVLDLNGYTIKTEKYFSRQGSGSLTIKDSRGGGTIMSDSAHALIIENGPNLTIEGGIFCSSGEAALYIENGAAVICGGTFDGIECCTKDLIKQLSQGHCFYDENNNPIPLTDGQKTLNGTVTVKECTHTYKYTHIADTTTHTKTCLACGREFAAETCCFDESGHCDCGAALEVILPDNLSLIYDGTEQKPDVTVTLDGKNVLTENTDYTLKYGNNINAGTATVSITGTGFNGEVKKTFSIRKATPKIGTVKANTLTDTLDISQIELNCTEMSVAGKLTFADNNGLRYGTNDYTWKFTPNDTNNYESVTGMVEITVNDTIMPSAEYQIDTNGWKKFVNSISFGMFCKDYKTIEIKGTDTGSGVAKTEYYISDKEIAKTDNITWNSYTEAVCLDAKGTYFIYVKVTDNAGNTVVLNSEGIVVYAESELGQKDFDYTYKEKRDCTIQLAMNGNTFKELTDKEGNAIDAAGYTIDESGRLTLKASYLDTLDKGIYTYQVSMNPQGVETAQVALTYNFTVNVKAKELTVTRVSAADRVYNGLNEVEITEVTLNGIAPDDVAAVDLSGLHGTLSSANAGTYSSVILPKLTLIGADSGNYTLVQPDAAVPVTVEIMRLDSKITVGADTYEKTFGDKSFILDVTDNNTEADVQYEVTSGTDVVSVSNGMVTILNTGTASITISLPQSANYNAATDKAITVNVAKKGGYVLMPLNRNYLHYRENKDSINLAELLPKDCGVVTYGKTTVSGNVTFNVAPSVNDGELSYTLNAGNENDEGTISINAATRNYEDILITVNVKLTDRIPVSLKNGNEVTLENNVLTFGETLSKLIFNETEFVGNDGKIVEGTLAWKDAAATPDVVTTSAIWVFTPDKPEYISLEGTAAIRVNKAQNAPNMPDSTMDVPNSRENVGDIFLPEGWEWKASDKDTSLEVGVSVTAVAVYTGSDKGNYEEETVTVAITRLACDHVAGDICYTVAGEKAPTCTKNGLGHIECTECKTVMEYGIVVKALGHHYKNTVTKKPTAKSAGIRTYTCTRCGYSYTKSIPKLTSSDDGKVRKEEVERNSAKLDSGIFVKWKGNTLTLSWPKISGAKGYEIFAAESGKKLDKSRIRTVKGNKTSTLINKIAGRKISVNKVYMVKIKVYRYVNGKKVYSGSSRIYYTAGKENKKYTNVKSLKPAKKKYVLKKGKSVRIPVSIVKQSKKKKLLPKSCGPALQYWSNNKNIATVTKEGKVKAKKKGSCYIYVTALNGVRTKIKITVK